MLRTRDAEEPLGLRPPGPHLDVDLLSVVQDFATVDSTVREAGLDEIVAKRLPHKRALPSTA